MKTLVVLSALAAVALAAPTLLEHGSEDFKKLTNIPENFKRERKSVQESSNLAPVSAAPASHISDIGMSGRSFGLKKPIIIKKKPVGYQVYRDSDEVPADSGETCGSQVKVKFCDGNTKLKSSTIDDTNTKMMEEDMKHSITLAKEAIEDLQRDLSTVERNSGTQASSWNHGHSESDAELHQDIENAREALEHIHNNFGNFESMSLHATTLKEADAPFAMAKTEEQRLAQWKEAIDTIQKNVEIAKNIEDSFKMAPDGETGLLISDDMMIDSNKHELSKIIDHNMRTPQDIVTKPESETESENCNTEHSHEKSSETENNKDGLIEDDMTSSASTVSEKKLKGDQARQTSQLLADNKTNQLLKDEKSLEVLSKEKEAIVDITALTDLSQKSVMSDIMKSVEGNNEEKDKKIMLAESVDNLSAPEMKYVETEDMLTENQKNAAVSTEILEKLETDQHPQIKSAEHFDEQLNNKNKEENNIQADLHTEQSKQIDTTLFAKSAEEFPTNTQEDLVETKMQGHMAINEPEKHLVHEKIANNEDLKTQSEILASVNDAEQELQFHPEMRTSEDLKNMHQQMINPQTRWADNKNLQLQRESMASANGVHSHTVQHPGHHHHVAHGMKNHFDTHIPIGHELHSRFPEPIMMQEKSADQDMQAYYMSMRDGMGLAPENNRFRWKPMHEGPRSAYGAPAAPIASPPSGGAVGVFPNANVGSCGIPLLLSCNPSVVSGSLAKPSPVPYSAPAYRTEDDFTFHSKRDARTTHENIPSPLHRMSKPSLKTSTVLVAKQ